PPRAVRRQDKVITASSRTPSILPDSAPAHYATRAAPGGLMNRLEEPATGDRNRVILCGHERAPAGKTTPARRSAKQGSPDSKGGKGTMGEIRRPSDLRGAGLALVAGL